MYVQETTGALFGISRLVCGFMALFLQREIPEQFSTCQDCEILTTFTKSPDFLLRETRSLKKYRLDSRILSLFTLARALSLCPLSAWSRRLNEPNGLP